jgi:glutamate racemase
MPSLRLIPFIFLTALTSVARADDLPAIINHVATHREPSAIASVPWDRYSGDLRRLPIGVFDSGIGGLTVLEAILKLDAYDNASGKPGADGVADFAGERFIYLGDQANMPYGNYSAAGRVDYLRELIVRDGLFLLGDRYDGDDGTLRRDKTPVKAIVIACNTATAYGLDDLRAALTRWNVPIPVVGVVEAGGRGAIDSLRADTQAGAAAILATVGTCDSGAYPKTIARLAGQQGLQAPAVCQRGSAGLAAAIEGTAGSVDDCIRLDIGALVEAHHRAGVARPIRTVVLGCTHYPLVRDRIEREFMRLREHRDGAGTQPYLNLIAERLTFVDPGEYTAKELFRELFLRKLRLPAGEKSLAECDAFYVTVGRDGPLPHEYKYGRKPGNFESSDVRTVSLAGDGPSRTALDLWRKLLPHVAERMK